MTELAGARDAADATWRSLTGPQRELLLSTAGGAPTRPERRDLWHLLDEGYLVTLGGVFPELTHAGRMLIQRRSHP